MVNPRLPACLQPVLPVDAAPVGSISRSSFSGPTDTATARPEGSVAEWIDQALELWLQVQPSPHAEPANTGSDDRAALIWRLNDLFQRIEAAPNDEGRVPRTARIVTGPRLQVTAEKSARHCFLSLPRSVSALTICPCLQESTPVRA